MVACKLQREPECMGNVLGIVSKFITRGASLKVRGKVLNNLKNDNILLIDHLIIIFVTFIFILLTGLKEINNNNSIITNQ